MGVRVDDIPTSFNTKQSQAETPTTIKSPSPQPSPQWGEGAGKGLQSEFSKQGTSTRRDLLERFLNAYWLRPENAFWMTIRSETLARCSLRAPTVDVCCGDGLFSFLHVGGVLDTAFDVFQAVGSLDRVHASNADMFDHETDDYAPQIVGEPTQTIHTGLDLKEALLSKARKLNLYKQLIEHDSNTRLPFGDESFETIYCNAAYWISNIDGFLKELRRIVRPGGKIILQVKLDSMREYNLSKHRDMLGDRFLEIIARGRLETWPTLGDEGTWEGRFKAAGLNVAEKTPFITATHAHIWDIGLRPLAPLLVRMANGVAADERRSIKRDWVSLLLELCLPLCDPAFGDNSRPPAEVQYELVR